MMQNRGKCHDCICAILENYVRCFEVSLGGTLKFDQLIKDGYFLPMHSEYEKYNDGKEYEKGKEEMVQEFSPHTRIFDREIKADELFFYLRDG